jgi:hypothetical protein
MTGYVYVFSNPAYQSNLIKIGQSKSDPTTDRAIELGTTGFLHLLRLNIGR